MKVIPILILLLVLTACSTLLDPEDQAKLVLYDGSYENFTDASGETHSAIQWKYRVKSVSCQIGGYGIIKGDHTASVSWWKMKTIEPGIEYTFTDTLNSAIAANSGTRISMEGYIDHDHGGIKSISSEIHLVERK